MSRVAAAVLLLGLLGTASCGEEKPKPVAPAAYPSADVFEDMDTKDAVIVGVVRGQDGGPAAGASVLVDAYVRTFGEDESHPHDPQVVTTDSKGRFVFRSSEALREEARRTRVKVWAELDDLVAPQVLLRVASPPEVAQTLTLGPSLVPKVSVAGPDGKPVANAYVELDFDVPAFDSFELLYTLGARSGADGIAVLPRLPDRSDWHAGLRVNAEGMPQYVDDDMSIRRLRGSEPVTVRLPAGCTVRGRVELPDGSPAAGVSISAYAAFEPRSGGARTAVADDTGAFVLRGVPAERVIVHVAADPPPPATFDPAQGAVGVTASARLTREIHGKEGEAVDVGTLRLVRTLSISGVVLDAAGKPAAYGHVRMVKEGVPHSAVGHSIKAGGRFEVTGLDPGRHTLKATIYESGFRFGGGLEAKLKNVPAGAADVEIRVTGGGNLIVRFHPVGKPDEPLEVWDPMLISPTQGGGGPSGKYTEIRRVFEPGRYSDFFVEAEGYKEKRLGPVKIRADRPTFVDVELEATPQNGR